MDGSSRELTVGFTASGEEKLREGVDEKLKELMGDYADDTLVEYVMVLIKSGRQKEEARKELDLFLGDNNASFVTWLYDHLNSNLDLYFKRREPPASDGMEDSGKNISQTEDTAASATDHSEQDTAGVNRSRRNKGWKGLVMDEVKHLLSGSLLVDDVDSTESLPRQRNSGHLSSSMPHLPRKRVASHEEQIKRRVAARSMQDAPSRLLRFSVRDAVQSARNATWTRQEPSLNSTRSVVSASMAESYTKEESPRERSVLDGLARHIGRTQISQRSAEFEDQMMFQVGDSDAVRSPGACCAGMTFQHSVAKDVNESARTAKMKDQEPPVNVNTGKTENYKALRAAVPKQPPAMIRSGEVPMKLPVQSDDTQAVASRNKKDLFQQISETPRDAHHKPAPSSRRSYSSSQAPSYDADSRTIFVSNVHFAATREAVTRHFIKFGEVLKVSILTDAATGQANGSAHVLFLRKESAELALSLNGTYFMSRILKVVKVSTSHHETRSAMSWHGTGASFASGLGRIPCRRGSVVTPFPARVQHKHGTRSLQWKRDAATVPSHGNSVRRSLTYVRPESK